MVKLIQRVPSNSNTFNHKILAWIKASLMHSATPLNQSWRLFKGRLGQGKPSWGFKSSIYWYWLRTEYICRRIIRTFYENPKGDL